MSAVVLCNSTVEENKKFSTYMSTKGLGKKDRVGPGSYNWVTWLAPVNIRVWNYYLNSLEPLPSSGSFPDLNT